MAHLSTVVTAPLRIRVLAAARVHLPSASTAHGFAINLPLIQPNMKQFTLALLFLASWAIACLAQSNPPLRITEVDGDPNKLGITKIVVSNGTLTINGTTATITTGGGGGGGGTVTSVSVTTANGVSGSVANPTTTPAITLTLGAITPTTVNGLTITSSTGTFTLTNAKTLSVSNSLTLAGTDSTTMTFPSTSGAVLTAASTATLTNKTYDTAGTGNSFSIGGQAVTSVSGNAAKVVTTTGTLTSGDCVKIDASGNFIANGSACSSGGSSLPVIDTTSIVEGSADATKEIRFEVDGLTTGTVRVLTPQNADYTLAGTNITQTFTAAQIVTVNQAAETSFSVTNNNSGAGAFADLIVTGDVKTFKFAVTSSGNATYPNALIINDSGTTRMSIDTNGIVRIGGGLDASAQADTGLIVSSAGGASNIAVRDSSSNAEGAMYAGGANIIFGSVTNNDVLFNRNGSTLATIGASTLALSVAPIVTVSSANAFTVGPNGTTNPTLNVVTNVASAATGLSVTSRAAGSGVDLTVLSSGSNENLNIVPLGTTGKVTLGSATAGTYRVNVNGAPVATVALGIVPSSVVSNDVVFFGSTAAQVSGNLFAELFSADVTSNLIQRISNTNNTSSAGAVMQIIVGGSSAFDPYLQLSVNGVTDWSVGIDNSVSDVLKIGPNATPSTGTAAVMIDTSRNMTIGGATAVGTSGAGAVILVSGTAPTTSPADVIQFYSADAAAGDANLFVRNELGEINRLTGLSARVSTQFDSTSTSLADVTGLSRNVEAGRAYAFQAILFINADTTGGSKFAIKGTATATSVIYEIKQVCDATNLFTISSRQTALDGSGGQAGCTASITTIEGTIVVNAAGTLIPRFAQNAATGTSSVLVNSSFRLIPIS